MCIVLLFFLSLLPLSAHAVHRCDANTKLDEVPLDSNCLKADVSRMSSGPVTSTLFGSTIQNLNISSGGDCITIAHSNVTVKNNSIGRCGRSGVKIKPGVNGTLIINNYIHDVELNGVDVDALNANAGKIYMNKFYHNRIDVLLQNQGAGWLVEHNHFIDAYPKQNQGLRGQAVQSRGTSVNAKFRCNRIDNIGLSARPADCAGSNQTGMTGDLLSVINFSGNSHNVLRMEGNNIRGGSIMQRSSVNVNPGDYASNSDKAAWATSEYNIMVKENASCGGATGTGGGHDLYLNNNVIAGSNQSASFAPPLEARKGPGSTICGPYVIGGNKAWYTDRNRRRQDGSVRRGCSTPKGWETNNWNVPVYTHPDGNTYALNTQAGRTELYYGSSLMDSCNACSDGIDNDMDTRTDYPEDPGCKSKWDNSESGAAK